MIQNNQENLLHLQQKAGTDMDFFLAVKNNVQKSEGAYSAGKVLIFILCLMKLLLEQGKHLRI